jgi:hypothetical protein
MPEKKQEQWSDPKNYITIKVGAEEWRKFKIVAAANGWKPMHVINWLMDHWTKKNKKVLEDV